MELISIWIAQLDFRKRQCAVALRGPWGHGARLVACRVLFRFPAGYPGKSGSSGAPAFKLVETPEIPVETYEAMRKTLHTLCDEVRPCLAACISYLLGHDERKSRADLAAAESDSDSDSEVQQAHNVPSKRTCGMCWGPNGEFLTKLRPHVKLKRPTGR